MPAAQPPELVLTQAVDLHLQSQRMEPLKPGQNPRLFFESHRERGPQRFSYTYEDLAALLGVGIAATKTAVRHELLGGGSHLAAVGRVFAKRRRPCAVAVPDDQLAAAFGNEREAAMWRRRWPQLQLYKCAANGCRVLTVDPDGCSDHGVSMPTLNLSRQGWRMQIRLGDKAVMLHRLLCPTPPGYDVHHRDHNRFNNHPSNLVALTHDDHMRIHRGQVEES